MDSWLYEILPTSQPSAEDYISRRILHVYAQSRSQYRSLMGYRYPGVFATITAREGVKEIILVGETKQSIIFVNEDGSPEELTKNAVESIKPWNFEQTTDSSRWTSAMRGFFEELRTEHEHNRRLVQAERAKLNKEKEGVSSV